jgi:hypothetical protein
MNFIEIILAVRSKEAQLKPFYVQFKVVLLFSLFSAIFYRQTQILKKLTNTFEQ